MNLTFQEVLAVVMPPDLLQQIAIKKSISRIVDCDERNRMIEAQEIQHRWVTLELCL